MQTRGRVLLSLGVLALLCFARPSAVMAPDPGAAPGAAKIESRLSDLFQTQSQADFILRFLDQPDLNPAYGMTWEERGSFVLAALEEAAERSQRGARELLEGLGLRYRTFLAGNDLYVHGGSLSAALQLGALPEVASIRATRTYEVPRPAPALQATVSWGISDTGADDFWAAFLAQGNGILVANIDTGVQWDHPALVDRFHCPGDPAHPACWSDPSDICGAAGACDNNGHGSHTMGTMVGYNDPDLDYLVGMAPGAEWIACKGCESDSCSDFALNACADWILAPAGNPANRPHIVNNSWGGSGNDTWYQAKVNAWRAMGIFPAFSCGNFGSACGTLGSPGDYQESVCSAAHDSGRTAATFSSRGPSAFGHAPYTKPNLSAPGVGICSTVPTDSWNCGYSGTSMASPHTAGAVALLWSCNPSLIGQITETTEFLQDHADSPGEGNCGAPPDGQGNYTFGYGYLNVYAAGAAACTTGGQSGTLNGHVYNRVAGSPVPGVKVKAENAGYARFAYTSAEGFYTLDLPPGAYEVTASATDYDPATASGVVVVDLTVTTQDFHLEPGGYGAWALGPALCFDLTRLGAEYLAGTGKIYILGGRAGVTTYGDIYAFDPATGSCEDTGADMPTPVSNYSVSLVHDGSNHLLCTFGGRDGAGNRTANVQCYNPASNTAYVKTTLPAEFTDFIPGGQAVVDNKVYLFGGFRPAASPPYLLAATFRYDPVANSFTRLGDLSLARGFINTAVVDGVIYALGGNTFDGSSLIATDRTERMADPAGAGTWDDAAVADLPTPNGEGRAFGFGRGAAGYNLRRKIVLAGGGQWPGETPAAILYDVATNTYETAFPDLNVSRRNHAMAFAPLPAPRLWVFGGRIASDDPPYAPAEFYELPRRTQPRAPAAITILLLGD